MMDQITAQLTQIACEGVIKEAAQVYAASIDPAVDYGSYMIMGADAILCRPDERIASSKERLQWKKWKWFRWASAPADLTLHGCIRFLMQDCEEEVCEEDALTLEQVFFVLDGGYIYADKPTDKP